MKDTRAFIRELLKNINMNKGKIPEDIKEMYYKADKEIKKVEEEYADETSN